MDHTGFPAESPVPTATNAEARAGHRYDENEVRNHYAALGEGSLILMLYGFPNY